MRILKMLALGGLVLTTGVAVAQEQKDNKLKEPGVVLKATLTGAAETPGPGDPDGSGQLTLKAPAGRNRLCFEIMVVGIEAPTVAHIFKGGVGQSGPHVVTLSKVATNASSENCVEVEAQLIADMQQSPGDYYFNVHNSKYPDGALRGQLSK